METRDTKWWACCFPNCEINFVGFEQKASCTWACNVSNYWDRYNMDVEGIRFNGYLQLQFLFVIPSKNFFPFVFNAEENRTMVVK